MKRITLLVIVIFMCLCSYAQSQKDVVHVQDETGFPIIGANVMVVGSSFGTITDWNGNATLYVPASANQLEISYIGYITQTVSIQPNILVILVEDIVAFREDAYEIWQKQWNKPAPYYWG